MSELRTIHPYNEILRSNEERQITDIHIHMGESQSLHDLQMLSEMTQT